MIFENGGKAVIEDGFIVIRVAIEALPLVVSGGPHSPYVRVTHIGDLAKSIVHVLNDEDECGGTAIHRLFDEAIGGVIDDGNDGLCLAEEEEEEEA